MRFGHIKFVFSLSKPSKFLPRRSSTGAKPDESIKKPLGNIKIVDMTRVLAGPYCTMILGDLGANIVKIEKPQTGDDTRAWGPPFIGTESCYFLSVNRNKRSVCIDIKTKEGQDLVKELVVKSDVFVENFVPGTLDKLNLGYEELSAVAPSIIYCSITGYGPSGPYRTRPGYDLIAASAGGLLSVTGAKDGDPCKVGVAMTDLATGLYAHGSILAAVIQRQATGKGQKIDVDLFSTQLASLVNLGSSFLNSGLEPKRWGTEHENIVPYQTFKTSDGYITISAGNDAQFVALCGKLNVQELTHDERFKTNRLRVTNRRQLISILSEIFIKKSTTLWLGILEGSTFPYGPVNTFSQVFSDPHVKEVGLVKELPHNCGSVKLVGPPVKYSYATNEISRPPPLLGQHTEEVLKEVLGIEDARLDELRKKKVIS